LSQSARRAWTPVPSTDPAVLPTNITMNTRPLYFIHLTTPAADQITECWMEGPLINNGLESVCKEAMVTISGMLNKYKETFCKLPKYT
jgi:hypothetical protein